MTTKKQKREAGRIKREQWLKERKVSGLNAQKADHENRKNKLRDSQREKHNKEHDWKTLDKNCILCEDKLEEARRRQKSTEAGNG